MLVSVLCYDEQSVKVVVKRLLTCMTWMCVYCEISKLSEEGNSRESDQWRKFFDGIVIIFKIMLCLSVKVKPNQVPQPFRMTVSTVAGYGSSSLCRRTIFSQCM